MGSSIKNEVSAQENQTVIVQRGDLNLEIAAAGNLALSHTEDLAIDLFYQEGTIEEVLVKDGDIVEEGQVLINLDADEWNDELNALQKALTTAKRNLTSKESTLTSTERQVTAKEKAVTDAERQVTTKDLAVSQAQLDLDTAAYNLSQVSDLKDIQDEIDSAQFAYDVAVKMLTGDMGGAGGLDSYTYWAQLKTQAKSALTTLEDEKDEILSGTSLSTSESVALELTKYKLLVDKNELALADAKAAVEDAQIAVDDAKYAVTEILLELENAKLDVEDAKQTVEEAQSDLDKAKDLSPVITSPFSGFVTKVNVEGGDEVMKGTVVVQIADPNKFEADILVSELDISQVQEGGDASVLVDAFDLSLEAKVTHIAPTATISSGVVNYNVTVEVQSIPEDANLKEGMTVTVSLIVSNRQDVLLVPYEAITKENGQSYVQVLLPDDTIEKRAITTGVTDYQYTEVTEGLSEGEQVLISQWTASESTTTTEQQQQSQGSMIPMSGMGPTGGPPGG
jgi:RND family efflux transporter MFP subunit